jgi:prepilin-type processing-associated H-X9-DG protein
MCQQAPSAAEKLAGKMPDGTFAFVAASGMEQIRPAFNQSSIGQLWNDPNMQSFYTQIKSTLLNKLQAELAKSGKPEDKQIAATVSQLLEEAAECPMIAGVSEISADPNQMPFRFFFVLEAGKHKNSLQPLIGELEKAIGKEQIVEKQIGNSVFHSLKEADDIPILWGWYRDYFVCMVNDPKAETIKGLQSQTIKPTPLTKVKGYGDTLAFYCDTQKAAAMISHFAQKEGGNEEIAAAKKVIKSLGLDTVKSVTMRAGFDRSEMIAEKWIEVPGPQTGIFTALKPIDMTMADKVDASATNTVILNTDWAVLYDVIWGAIRDAASDQERDKMQAAITEFEKTNNISIRNGLLKSLDGRVAGYSFPAMTLPEVPTGGAVLIARLKDAALFTQTMQALSVKVSQSADSQQLQIRTQTLEGGQTLNIWVFPQMAMLQIMPNWVIVDDMVVLTTNPVLAQIVVKQISSAKSGSSSSIRSVAAFRAMQTSLPAGVFYLEYSDTAANLKQTMMQMQQVWPMLVNMAAGQGIMLPVMLPNIQDKLGQLGQSRQYTWMDNMGLHDRCQGSGAGISAGGVAGVAMGLAILMPALNKTKMIAQRVISGTNLKGIGTANLVYANDHEGKFPPNLDILIKDCDLDPKMLTSPRKPDNFNGPSYVYIDGQNENCPAGNILAYEQPSFAKDGMINVLFVDGHTAALKKDEFQKELEKTYSNLGRPMPNEPKPTVESVHKPETKDPNQHGQ